MDITKAFPILMQQEGGSIITATFGDKGGLTKYGIAQASHPGVDIANLTEKQAQEIYAGQYWAPAHCSDLKDDLKYIHFSCAVNCGVVSAIKILQRAARVKDDGAFGPATLNAANSISIQDYAIEWNLHYKAIVENDATQSRFLKGWQNRIDFILQLYKLGKL